MLMHGQITHGFQFFAEDPRSLRPSAYYGPHTGAGVAVDAIDPNSIRYLNADVSDWPITSSLSVSIGGTVNLRGTDKGGSVSVGQAFVSEDITIHADRINLPYVEYTGTGEMLPIILGGDTRARAKKVDTTSKPWKRRRAIITST